MAQNAQRRSQPDASFSAADGPVPDYLSLLRVTVETIARGFEG